MPDPMMVSFSAALSRYFLDVYEGAVQPPQLDPTASLVENVRRLELPGGVTDRVAEFLDAVPPAEAAALVAAVASGFSEQALVQVAWLPAYAFELAVSHVRRDAALVSITLKSPLVTEVIDVTSA